MAIWFTGDTHFGHERTRVLSKRSFNNTWNMDETLINNWNKKVCKDDTVYHIGDFGDYTISHKLNGKIVLLLGNYERQDILESKTTLHGLRNVYNFYKVIDNKRFTIDVLNIDLVHEPSNRDINRFTLFGHIHKLQTVKKNALNVGVDCHNFAPISLEDVYFYKDAIDQHYDDEVFMQ